MIRTLIKHLEDHSNAPNISIIIDGSTVSIEPLSPCPVSNSDPSDPYLELTVDGLRSIAHRRHGIISVLKEWESGVRGLETFASGKKLLCTLK